MTAIVGVLCTDGIVIGADSSATFAAAQFRTVEQPTEKLELIGDNVLIAGTGQIGLGQRFKRIIEHAHRDKNFSKGVDVVDLCRQLCAKTRTDFGSTGVAGSQYGAIVAFGIGETFHLCEFAIADFQPELKLNHPKLWYVTMGSAQIITDPFFALLREVFWKESQPNVREGTFAALWALDHAIECNAGGVNAPARLAVIQKDGAAFKAKHLTDADLAEHREAIDQAKSGLKTALRALTPAAPVAAAEIPTVPVPGPDGA
jgi:20S proteasome alpha/beta subunit